MIVRILEDGQYEVDDETADALAKLDQALGEALDKRDAPGFDQALARLIDTVHQSGKRLDGQLRPSDLAVPAAGSTLDEVRTLLSSESTTED